MSDETRTIFLEAQEELKAEHHPMSVSSIDRKEMWCWDCGKSVPNLEQAVDQEVEEEEVNRLAHENCTPEDYS